MKEFVQGTVASEIDHAISTMRDERDHPLTGDILRRTCRYAGENACTETCQLVTETVTGTEVARVIRERRCSDLNLYRALDELRLPVNEVLMVGVTGDEVGFADSLDDYKVTVNPYGWRETKGFNAFFARVGELEAIGRLADCADINFEFEDGRGFGSTVFGFEHGTRPNMFGSSKYDFVIGDEYVSYTEYVMRKAIEHYDANPETFHIKLAAATQAYNFTKHFESAEQMEEHLPGWYEDGFVRNISDDEWCPGDPVRPQDTWEADTRGMIVRDIKAAMQKLGIPADNFSTEGIIDPGDSEGQHSSHQYEGVYGDSRDLYATLVRH